jgi:hypothetical protein
MPEIGGRLDLPKKPVRAERRGELRPEHLHRDHTPVPKVLGQIDGGHAARAELALDAVAVGEGGAKPRGDFDRGSAQCASIGWYLSSQASAS